MWNYIKVFCERDKLIFLLLINLLTCNAANVIVNTKQGQLRGERLQTVTGDAEYYSFKGIPYAKPPVGDLRFRAPQPPEHWSGVRNATQHGSVCIQESSSNAQNIIGSEDCLYLNVYTSNIKPKKKLSVMIFIHGGGFTSGSGNVDRFGPDYLINQNIVLVTINYRLGALGFLSLNNKEVPGNAALKDQVAAMKWVQYNIAHFGGDPNKVTIFGQSAGGASVGFHNLSPLTKGHFSRSVSMSGVPFNDVIWPFEPRRVAFRLGQQLGLWTNDDKQLLKFFKSLPAEKFLGLNPAVLRAEEPNNSLKQTIFTPVVETNFGEGHYMIIDPDQALRRGNIHDVDILIGHTALEGLLYFKLFGNTVPQLYTNYSEMIVPRKILENIAPAKMFNLADKIHKKYFGDKPLNDSVAKEFVNYMSEGFFNYVIQKYATLFSIHRKTYMYEFTRLTKFPRHLNLDNKFGINGATHEDDLLYLFYPHDGNVTIDKNSEDYKLVKITCALYTNFAKYGNPTPDNSLGVKWPQYNNVSGYYLDIDTKLSVGQHLDADVVTFWDSIYEAYGFGF